MPSPGASGPAQLAILGNVPVAPYPRALAVDPALGLAYVLSDSKPEAGGGLTAIDGARLAAAWAVSVGWPPTGPAVDVDAHQVYVGDGGPSLCWTGGPAR